MASAFRVVGAIGAGLLVAFILVIAVELFSSAVHPVPAEFSATMEEMCAHVKHYPHWVLAIVVPAWAAAAWAGTWVAGRFGNRGSALFVGLLLLAAAAFNVSELPYPPWFKVASLIAISAAVACGVYWSRHRETVVANIAE